ncbi:MAG TPA: hypothetical protein VNS09_19665, partial [Solirubrobacter sp.]|nr:hypothetical protein [Solirubrobacter sp.]
MLELGPSDVGTTFRVRVTAHNATGATSAVSAPTAAIRATDPPEINSPPQIIASDGADLELVRGLRLGVRSDPARWYPGIGATDATWQWHRCNESGEHCVEIAGAASP